MKKICITFLLLFIIILALICSNSTPYYDEYLRLHIRANSNTDVDQQVKYLVKQEVVTYLSDIAVKCTTKQIALTLIESELENIEAVADNCLKQNGFSYTSRATIKKEEFPTRVYEGYTLEEGIYDALIIELGEGVGDNWWCVIYPPLCFCGEMDGGSIKYRSLIYDIITEFFSFDKSSQG